MGKWPIMELAAKDTAAQNAENYEATSVCQAATKHILSCRGTHGGEPITVMHSSGPLILRKVSS
jgi:hypothetical protein